MSVREDLYRRPDIPDEEVDDIVAIAARLQDEQQQAAQGATAADIAAVAAELEIAPEFVDQALAQWRADKEADAEQAVATQRHRTANKRRNKLVFWGTIVALMGVLMSGFGVGLVGAGQVNAAHKEVVRTELQLNAVLEQQASMAPQLVALGGGDPAALEFTTLAVTGPLDMEERLALSRQLGIEMAKALAAQPGTMTEADAQIRLNLHHEVTGLHNRIKTETKRYRAAKAEHEAAASGLTGRMATTIGLAEAPN